MMAYRKNFVVAIKHRGRILRELDEAVKLPFGSEYSILLKNKDSRRAVAEVEIDGQDVVDGHSLIVEANTTIELTGFMKGMVVRNRFRFIEKTEQISKYRGDRVDDGLVRVEFRFEKIEVPIPVYIPPMNPVTPQSGIWAAGGPIVGSSLKSSGGNTFASSAYYCNSIPCSDVTDDGITVKGSETHQGFTYGSTKELETASTVITLKLRGVNKKTKKFVKKAVSVKSRLACTTCGQKSRSSGKYCPRCGTYLH
jgi:hypothetical protein